MGRFVVRDEEGINRVSSTIRAQKPQERPVEVIVRPYRRRRSLPQNDRMHALLRCIADFTGEDVDRVKAEMARRFLGERSITVLGKLRHVPRETSGLTVPEMNDFMMQLEAFCAEWGIPMEESNE